MALVSERLIFFAYFIGRIFILLFSHWLKASNNIKKHKASTIQLILKTKFKDKYETKQTQLLQLLKYNC